MDAALVSAIVAALVRGRALSTNTNADVIATLDGPVGALAWLYGTSVWPVTPSRWRALRHARAFATLPEEEG